jgi:hypothetical protein
MLSLKNGPIVLLGGLDDALLGGSLCAEGGYKGAILATQYEDVGVRLVQVVVEFREHRLLHHLMSVLLGRTSVGHNA